MPSANTIPGAARTEPRRRGARSWQHFEHVADIGVRGCGATLEEAFEEAGKALTAIVTRAPVASVDSRAVEVEAPDPELLFADWLNAIVYEMAIGGMLFSDFDVKIDGQRLRATLRGEPVDRVRHQPAVEIKGATYTGLKVRQRADGIWCAECVVDV